MNIPNMLTVLRLILVPVYVAIFACEGEQKTVAAIIFMIASITDVLDGYIARKYNMTTKTGQLLDPLADKLMQIAVVVTMLCAGMVPLWFVLVLASKEILMILGGLFLYTKKTFVKSNVYGKLNTVVVFCAMIILLIFSETNEALKNVMLTLVVFTSAASIISYMYTYFFHQKKFKTYLAKTKTEGLTK